MGLFVKLLAIACCLSPLLFADLSSDNTAGRILYLMQTGQTSNAIALYQGYIEKNGKHDLELVQQLGISILEQGYRSQDPEIVLLTMFGAGISMNERMLYILEEGIRSATPQIQLVCLNLLSQYQHDDADEMINYAMTSNHLLIRLEGAYHLSLKKAPKAVGQTEALMAKVDPELLPIFPQLYALMGNVEATKILRRLMSHSNEQVRMAAILSAAKAGRDDFLPAIRILAAQHTMGQQEACAVALGMLKDESSVSRLEAMSHSTAPLVRLAALQALYRLGRHEVRPAIEEIAKTEDLFAIYALGEMEGSENLLAELIKSNTLQVRINATLALLQRKDARCLYPLCEILIRDSRDLAFMEVHSQGGGLTAYKAIPSAQQNLKETPMVAEMSLAIREEAVCAAMDLLQKDFLRLAHTLFEAQQNDLIPILVDNLETLNSPEAIALLKRHQQKAGAPLIRNYCNLALYRLKETGPYADNLRSWIVQQQQVDLIRFRPLLPWEMRESHASSYQLTPEETSRLLIESLEALLQGQDEHTIDILLDAINTGNAKNKFALAGLLIRAVQ